MDLIIDLNLDPLFRTLKSQKSTVLISFGSFVSLMLLRDVYFGSFARNALLLTWQKAILTKKWHREPTKSGIELTNWPEWPEMVTSRGFTRYRGFWSIGP